MCEQVWVRVIGAVVALAGGLQLVMVSPQVGPRGRV